MSETAPETQDFTKKLEALAAEGFHLVFSDVEKFIIEKVDHAGTQSFEGKTLEEAIGLVEDKLASHPGAPVTVISRSDGIHESVDGLQTQAGKPEPAEGQSGTTPSARTEVVDLSTAPDNPAEQADAIAAAANDGAGANVVAPDATEPALVDPEAQAEATAAPEAAPETSGVEQAPAVDTSGVVSTEPGQVATGPIGTPADEPAPEAEPAPEGAVES